MVFLNPAHGIKERRFTCNALVRIIRPLNKVQVLYYTTQLLLEIQTFSPIYTWYHNVTDTVNAMCNG